MGSGKSPTRNLFLLCAIVLISTIAYIFTSRVFESNHYEPIGLAKHFNGSYYAGSSSCTECHFNIHNTHIKTAHYRTSALADTNSVKGNFEKGKNQYQLNENIAFDMINANELLFQEAYITQNRKQISKSKMDLVIGSGTKGQSYLTWSNDSLYQLQVSYFKPTDSWANSPGMPNRIPLRPRKVNAKCMECHTTFSENTSMYGMGNTYNKDGIIYGIDCERCHGPSREHVVFHKKNPEVAEAQFMMKYNDLSRQQRLDACALCHSGARENKRPAFEFLAGDNLLDFSLPQSDNDSVQQIDVHGNQYALLTSSKCFMNTPTMDCSSCHNPHKNQRGKRDYFNQKCIACHQGELVACSNTTSYEKRKATDCVNCHMPLRPSKSMFINSAEDSVKIPVMVRTHLIDVYIDQMQ